MRLPHFRVCSILRIFVNYPISSCAGTFYNGSWKYNAATTSYIYEEYLMTLPNAHNIMISNKEVYKLYIESFVFLEARR